MEFVIFEGTQIEFKEKKMISKTQLSIFAFVFITSTLVTAQNQLIEQKLKNPLLHQGLINSNNYNTLNKLSQNYPVQNTLNVGWLSVFRRYNSGETVQNRAALSSHVSENQLIFDMDQDRPLDWSKVTVNKKNQANFSEGQYVLSLETTNIKNENSPVVLILLSNQHTVNDYLSNPASTQLAKMGYTVATLEYPNYGASLGRASLKSWLSATRGAVRFLNELTERKIYIVGHSIGGPLALQAAAGQDVQGKIGGVVSYGGFSNLFEMSKDQQSNPIIGFFSKPITFITLKDNIIDGIGNLDELAKQKIPVLILHGLHDGAVTVRHANIYEAKMQQLRNKNRGANLMMKTVVFPNLYHEEVNNFTNVSPQDFHQVWDEITAFILAGLVNGSTLN